MSRRSIYQLGIGTRKRKVASSLSVLSVAGVLSVLLFNLLSSPAQALGGQEKIAYYGNWDIYGNGYTLKKVNDSGAAARLTTLV